MNPKELTIAIVVVVVCVSQTVSVAHAQGPLPIREESPGLLAQAMVAPAVARLTAFGEFPGAEMVAAEIRRDATRLLYAFEFKFKDHRSTNQVMIDAVSGQVVCKEYSVEQANGDRFAIKGPPDLVSIVESSYRMARNAVDEAAQHGRVVRCRFRVEPKQQLFVFDVEVGEEHVTQQLLVDASTGTLLSAVTPN